MNVRHKIYLVLLFLMIISSPFILIVIENNEEAEFHKLNESKFLIQELQNNLLSLRVNEKNFLKKHKEDHIIEFEKNYQTIQKNISLLLTDLNEENIDSSLLLLFTNSMHTYHLVFQKIIKKQKSFGLNENDSKYFELRKTVHLLLTNLKSNTKLYSDILQLRRHEKDFFLRKKLEYRDLFLKKAETIFTGFENERNTNLLKEYTTKFLELVLIQEQIGLTDNLGLMKQSNISIQESEEILETLVIKTIKEIEDQLVEVSNITDFFIILLLVIVILIITILVKFFMSESKVNDLKLLNDKLSKTLDNLKKTQDRLVESEKLASLGALVGGVAHEINTPLGIALTGITYLDEIHQNIHNAYSSEKMTKENFEDYLLESKDISGQVLNSIKTASALIQSFKKVSADQSSERKREFYIKDYADEIILSVQNHLKQTQINVQNNMPIDIKIDSYPGAFGQIITGLILNSIEHGYSKEKKGIITLSLKKEHENIIIHYVDDGKGIEANDLPHIFEPFFTTNRGVGNVGLGLHILYNIMRKQFDGYISCESIPNKGVNFKITIPIE